MKIFINVIIILSEKDTVGRNKVMDNTLDESKNFDVQVPGKHAHGYDECDCFMLNYIYIFRINLYMAN